MKKQNLWFVAIVAIVAVVGIVLMISYSGGKAATVGEGELVGEAISGCVDECRPSGAVACSGSYSVKCGNFDTDNCLEWSTPEPRMFCQYGCQNGYCLPQPCANECSPAGVNKCAANTPYTCGNYDTDSCLEWGKENSCQYGCENGVCLEP